MSPAWREGRGTGEKGQDARRSGEECRRRNEGIEGQREGANRRCCGNRVSSALRNWTVQGNYCSQLRRKYIISHIHVIVWHSSDMLCLSHPAVLTPAVLRSPLLVSTAGLAIYLNISFPYLEWCSNISYCLANVCPRRLNCAWVRVNHDCNILFVSKAGSEYGSTKSALRKMASGERLRPKNGIHLYLFIESETFQEDLLHTDNIIDTAMKRDLRLIRVVAADQYSFLLHHIRGWRQMATPTTAHNEKLAVWWEKVHTPGCRKREGENCGRTVVCAATGNCPRRGEGKKIPPMRWTGVHAYVQKFESTAQRGVTTTMLFDTVPQANTEGHQRDHREETARHLSKVSCGSQPAATYVKCKTFSLRVQHSDWH